MARLNFLFQPRDAGDFDVCSGPPRPEPVPAEPAPAPALEPPEPAKG